MSTMGLNAPRRAADSTRKGPVVSLPEGATVSAFARENQIPRRDLSNYLHKHLKRVGKNSRKIIRNVLIAHGVLKARPKRIPKCRNCGCEYPSRKPQ